MMRTLEITNVYELYDEVVTVVEVDIMQPDDFDPLLTRDEDAAAAYSDYLYETIHPLTGVGHEDGNSAYFIRSIDDYAPTIDEEYGT